MATYIELHTLAGSNVLIEEIETAITIAADTILNEDPTTPNNLNRLIWAKSAFDPKPLAKSFLYAMLAANKGASITVITASNDAQIQTAVDAAVDIFAGSA